MRSLPSTLLGLLLLSVAFMAACGGDDFSTIEPTPTEPIEERFAGVLTINGARTHSFESGGGGLTAALAELEPDLDATLAVGLALGTWSGTACQIVIADDQATQGTIVVGAASQPGNLCVRIYDVGNLTEATTYEILVTHQ